jgi:hypothetical protein
MFNNISSTDRAWNVKPEFGYICHPLLVRHVCMEFPVQYVLCFAWTVLAYTAMGAAFWSPFNLGMNMQLTKKTVTPFIRDIDVAFFP